VRQALFGVYLGMTFAHNHKGIPHPPGPRTAPNTWHAE
jgi:hypothetical protein